MSSIRRHLLIWLLSALTMAALTEDVWTYVQARHALDAVFDTRLRDVALAVAQQMSGPSSPPSPGDMPDPTAPLLQVWDHSGALVVNTRPGDDIPQTSARGLTTIPWGTRHWRFFVLSSGNGTIRVGETLEARREVTSRIARQIDLPLAMTFLPALALLIWAVVGRSLRPLNALAQSLTHRKPGALEPLADDRQPSEIRPIVAALNDLLRRVQHSLDNERRFIADAAHELQTPLTAVRLQSQVLARVDTEEEKKNALRRLDRGIQRATHVVRQLLTLARIDPEANRVPFDDIDLQELVIELLGEFTVIAQEKGVDLGTSVIEPLHVLGDRGSLAALLGNLIDNAVRYSPNGGKVDVNLRRYDSGPALEVVDNGPGIPSEERARVFDRFYRGAMTEVPGTGLGLAIVKQIADRHHAKLTLEKGFDGQGLRVTVQFRGQAG